MRVRIIRHEITHNRDRKGTYEVSLRRLKKRVRWSILQGVGLMERYLLERM